MMKITDIPFAKTLGLKRADSGVLELCFDESVHNHLQTVAAGAQYALAELASGEQMIKLFPELVGHVIPVLRDSRFKFKKPARGKIFAFPSVSEKVVGKFNRQFEAKGRGLIAIDVEVRDAEGTVTSSGFFSWYIQKI